MKKRVNKDEQRNKMYFFVGIVSVLIIGIVIIRAITFSIESDSLNVVISIKNDKVMWDGFDKALDNTKVIMDRITNENKDWYWWNIELEIDDKEYQSALNLLVSDIRSNYLQLREEQYEGTNPILNYRDKKVITITELKSISDKFTYGLLTNYNYILVSENKERREEFLSVVNEYTELISSDLFTKENPTYEELMIRNYLHAKAVEDLALFLEREYEELG